MTDEQRNSGKPMDETEMEGTPVYEETGPSDAPGPEHCAQCDCEVTPANRVTTDNAVFCSACYEQLKRIIEESVDMQSRNINFPMAAVGGLVGGCIGAAVWWGFTVVTNIQFGLVAVLIGWAVGKGVVTLSGNKRAKSLQLMSVGIAAVCYLLANYWVIRTSILKYYASQGESISLALIPDPGLLMEISTLGFEFFDLIFIAIALWQAWKMPAPIQLQTEG